ncbi:MAG: glycosyltransferase family 9 protein [Candidatus Omnitrophica bacterium]|nr:glycosyltransferase family 9 protein [Candidatus Omnitrophota bacterium]MDE2232419.1 glycosyltransferase family 9 protein [Candidatus Omnitrophota bacterium]
MNYAKILVINPYGIGDVLFTTPVIRNLRLAFPKATIAYLANGRTAEFLKFNGDIAEIFVYDRDEFVKAFRRSPLAFAQKWMALFNDVRGFGFDVVFDYSLNTTFGFLAAACGIKKRIGFDYRGRGKFLNHKVPLAGFEDRHVVDYFLDLLKFVDAPAKDRSLRLDVPQADIRWAREWIGRAGIDARKPLVAVFPGGGASWGAAARFRLWGGANYAQLTDKIIENYDAAVILMGDSQDIPLCREVCSLAQFPLYSAAGQTSLLGLAALFKQCRAAVINDAGAVHVAVASGTKAISIYGPVDPNVYGPYPPAEHMKVQKGLACQPCYRRFRMPPCSHISCLRDLSVDDVYRKVQEIL